MKAKMTAVALAVTLGLAAGAANATTTSKLTGTSFQFADGKMAKGSFSDVFNFTEAAKGVMNGFSINDTKNGYSAISYSLYDVTDSKSIYSGSGIGSFNFSELYNAGDKFTLTVKGTDIMTNANYHGTISTSPVPEASEWAMMASGLGLLGFIATRRRSSSAI